MKNLKMGVFYLWIVVFHTVLSCAKKADLAMRAIARKVVYQWSIALLACNDFILYKKYSTVS